MNEEKTGEVLSIGDYTVCISKEAVLIYEFKRVFVEKAKRLEQEYATYYDSTPISFDSLFKEKIPHMFKKSEEAFDFALEVLQDFGIVSIKKQELVNRLKESKYVEPVLLPIQQKLNSMKELSGDIMSYEELKRKTNTQSNTSWLGGGYGFSGSLKGAVASEVFNFGTEMLGVLGNTIANAGVAAKISKMQKELANAESTKLCLLDGVYNCCVGVFWVVRDILCENNKLPKYKIDEDMFYNTTGAEKTLEDFEDSKKTEEDYKETVAQLVYNIGVLSNSPEQYAALYKIYRGDKNEIHDLAKYFGVERAYKNLIIKTDMDYLEDVMSWKESNINEIDKKLSELNLLKYNNPYININHHIKSLISKKNTTTNTNNLQEKICEYKKEADEHIEKGDISHLWELMEKGNTYAESKLILHYEEKCRKKGNGYYTDDEKEKIMYDVRQKANAGNKFAQFVMLFVVYDITNTKELFDLTKQIEKEEILASPLYYTGYYAIKRSVWADDNGFTKEDAIRCVIKAADMLFPPAIEYVSELYKYGKYGIVTSNPELAKHYDTLNKAYKNSVSPLMLENDNSLKGQLSHIYKNRGHIDKAIYEKDFSLLWEEVNNGNVYAEFILRKHYLSICQRAIDNANLNELNVLLKDLDAKKNIYTFADFLYSYILYFFYITNRRDLKKADEYAKKIISLSNTKCVSAIFQAGYWLANGNYSDSLNISNDTEIRKKGITLLEKSAKLLYPLALCELGCRYYKGDFPLSKDIDLATHYLTLAVAYDIQRAKDMVEKIEKEKQQTTSSGCFITSAVCESFGYPDDCYELTTFRAFRDNWLIKQPEGKLLIKEYYAVAPKIVSSINEQSNSKYIYQSIWEQYLSPCLRLIENKEYLKCKELYSKMVSDLTIICEIPSR